MKRFITSLFVVFLAFAQISAYAESSFYKYGTILASAHMENSTPFAFHNNGGFTYGYSNETKFSGERSLFVDTESQTTDTKNFGIQMFFVNKYDIDKSPLLFELYVKGFDIKPNGLKFFLLFQDENDEYISPPSQYSVICDDADANGWHRVWVNLQPSENDEYRFSKISYNVEYKELDGLDDGLGVLYFDDIVGRTIPSSIEIDDLLCNCDSVPLNNIRARGADVNNVKANIIAADLFDYTIIDGEAFIDNNNNLVFTGADGGIVTLIANFFGICTTFGITFEKKINISALTCTDNVYAITVSNRSEGDIYAYLILGIFDGERLSNVKEFGKLIPAKSNEAITSTEIVIPYYIKDPFVKTYVYSSISGLYPVQL